jgi:glycosyltransferase involved in cell wall biosynthesis
VVVRGYVPDLDDLMARSCALLVPLRFGSGIKIKVLEALARGVPVLSTPVGAEGIETGVDCGVLVEPDIARFPVHMASLAEAARNAALSARAVEHHASTYAAAAAYTHYDAIFGLGDAGR